MSKLLSIMASTTIVGTNIQRTIDNSPDFSGVQPSDTGQPERQISPGGFLTG